MYSKFVLRTLGQSYTEVGQNMTCDRSNFELCTLIMRFTATCNNCVYMAKQLHYKNMLEKHSNIFVQVYNCTYFEIHDVIRYMPKHCIY